MAKDVFICYAKKDEKHIRSIAQRLEDANISCWCDFNELKLGENWKNRIKIEIQKCSFFMVVLSANSTNSSGYRHNEIKMAIEIAKEISPNKIFILPVLIDDCEIHYDELKDIHNVRLDMNNEEGFNKIINAINYYKEKDSENDYNKFIEKTYENHLRLVRRDSSPGYINQQAGKIYRDIFEKNILIGLHKNHKEFDHTLLYFIAGRIKNIDNVYIASKSQDELAREITDQIINFLNTQLQIPENLFQN